MISDEKLIEQFIESINELISRGIHRQALEQLKAENEGNGEEFCAMAYDIFPE